MDKIISATDADRDFSRLLKHVQDGNSYTVTSDGRPVARIVPVEDLVIDRESAKKRLIEELRSRPILNTGPWTRDELYDD